MKFIYSYAEVAKLIGDDLNKKGLFDKEKQDGKLQFMYNKQHITSGCVEFEATVSEKSKPEEPYKAGDWKDEG